MLTRFKTNVARYPRLFAVTLALLLLAIVESSIVNTRSALVVDLALSFVLAVLVYRWVTSSADRLNTFLDIINRFEGRHEVCPTCSAPEESEDLEEDNPESYEG
jgi:hypothetical protein